jgi:hypothetical protein
MFDEERAQRDAEAVVSPGMVNDEFVALCPTFLTEDREEGFRKGCRALRFFAEAITHWAAPNGVAPARTTEHVDNAAFMAEHLQMAKDAIARGEAPPTAASSMYNTDHALGDADTAIAYLERLKTAGVDNVMCLIQMGTLTQDEMMETIRIFGERVIPHFRAQEAGADAGALAAQSG